MLDIKHTICPSCSVGCGLNIVSKDGAVVGTYPYKRHPINEGKNCLNGRNSILQFDNQIEKPSLVKNGELEESDYETVFKLIKDQLASIDASELAIICSGNSTNEELDKIKEFADGCGCEKIGFYGYFINHRGKRTPAPLVANMFEYGRSNFLKRPFFRKSFNEQQIFRAMKKQQEIFFKRTSIKDLWSEAYGDD